MRLGLNINFQLKSVTFYFWYIQALEIGTTAHSRVGFGPLAGIVASQTVMVEKSKRKQVQHSEKIGRISDTDHVSPHTHDEAVIHYSITSLGNLITDRRLRECVQRAIQSYIATRLHRISELRNWSVRLSTFAGW